MNLYETLKHTTWKCKCHVVFIPKYRREGLYAQLRRDLGPVFRKLAQQKESEVLEGHLRGACAYAAVNSAEVCGFAGDGF
jgi:putative transposase